MVKNGVRQGGIIIHQSYILCLYLDGLLCKLQAVGIGCRIGNLFTGVLAYADDSALLAPTVRAMRYTLKLCDDYAIVFLDMFNATKSKCVIVKPPRMCDAFLNIVRNRIEIVNRCPQLGHMIDCQCNDSAA